MSANYSADQKYFTGHMFNIKLEEKSYKMSFKVPSVKMQGSKNQKKQNFFSGGWCLLEVFRLHFSNGKNFLLTRLMVTSVFEKVALFHDSDT